MNEKITVAAAASSVEMVSFSEIETLEESFAVSTNSTAAE
jgi:hypothetical protein